MSLVTNVQRDIAEYEEKVFFGLTARKLVCLGSAVVLIAAEAALAYFVLDVGFDNIVLEAVVVLTAVIGFAVGYTRPMGMTIEKAAPLWMRQHFGSNVIVYKSFEALCEEDAAPEGASQNGKAAPVAARLRNTVKRSKGGNDAGKAEEQDRKDYRRIIKYRGARSPEYVIPRYHAAIAGEAFPQGAEGGDEGACG